MTLYSGKCIGGPANGGMLHHGEPVYQVGRDRHTLRVIVGYAGPSTDDIVVAKYHYEFSECEGPVWVWKPSTKTIATYKADQTDALTLPPGAAPNGDESECPTQSHDGVGPAPGEPGSHHQAAPQQDP